MKLHIVTEERDSLKRVAAAFTPSLPYEPGWMERRSAGVVVALGVASCIALMGLGVAFQRLVWPN